MDAGIVSRARRPSRRGAVAALAVLSACGARTGLLGPEERQAPTAQCSAATELTANAADAPSAFSLHARARTNDLVVCWNERSAPLSFGIGGAVLDAHAAPRQGPGALLHIDLPAGSSASGDCVARDEEIITGVRQITSAGVATFAVARTLGVDITTTRVLGSAPPFREGIPYHLQGALVGDEAWFVTIATHPTLSGERFIQLQRVAADDSFQSVRLVETPSTEATSYVATEVFAVGGDAWVVLDAATAVAPAVVPGSGAAPPHAFAGLLGGRTVVAARGDELALAGILEHSTWRIEWLTASGERLGPNLLLAASTLRPAALAVGDELFVAGQAFPDGAITVWSLPWRAETNVTPVVRGRVCVPGTPRRIAIARVGSTLVAVWSEAVAPADAGVDGGASSPVRLRAAPFGPP